MDWQTLNEAMTPNSTPDAVLQEYLPHYEEAMRAAQINTVRRAAAWHSQLGHESAGLRYMAEIQTSSPGWSWDRTRYRGRGPIQLTWQGNYRKFGQWCHGMGFVDDPELFVNQPELVEQPRWGFLAASWYWLNAGPRPGRINEYADNGDILAVSRCVNGWVEGRSPNGWEDREARYKRCLAMGDRILASDNGGSQMGFGGDPVWLEDVLRDWLGDRLAVEDGWRERGTGGTMGDIWGVLIHHTGNRNESVELIRDGRSDLAGPLSQCLIKPNGKCHLIAVGPCNHAGIGSYPGIGVNNGNTRLIGFECAWPTIRPDGSYDEHEKWPDAQIITMRDATAGVLDFLKYDQTHVIGHKEWATRPPNVKWDPGNIDMDRFFRPEVGKALTGQFRTKPAPDAPPPPAPVPPAPSPTAIPPDWGLQADDQVRGRWEKLGYRTQVEMLCEIGIKLDILPEDSRNKTGFTRGPKPAT